MLPLTGKFWIVMADFYAKRHPFGSRYIGWEGIVDRQCLSRDTVLAFLIAGEWDHPNQIIEVDLSAGTSRDVTHEFAREVDDALYRDACQDGREYKAPDWIECARYRLPKEVAA